jgi:hypothetical protein
VGHRCQLQAGGLRIEPHTDRKLLAAEAVERKRSRLNAPPTERLQLPEILGCLFKLSLVRYRTLRVLSSLLAVTDSEVNRVQVFHKPDSP